VLQRTLPHLNPDAMVETPQRAWALAGTGLAMHLQANSKVQPRTMLWTQKQSLVRGEVQLGIGQTPEQPWVHGKD